MASVKSAWWKRLWEEPGESPEEEAIRVPAVRCPTCCGRGISFASTPTAYHPPAACSFCGGEGIIRAQLVLSVVDLATGRVASRSIVPGAMQPVAVKGIAHWDLAAVVRELADGLGVESLHRASFSRLTPWNRADPYLLDLRYPLDEPVSERWRAEYEGVAIAAAARLWPQEMFYAGVEPKVLPDADSSLRRLAYLAADLQLDLVVQVWRQKFETLCWNVRLDIPGTKLPNRSIGSHNTLHHALVHTDAEQALIGLRQRPDRVPARWLEVERQDEAGRASADVDELTWAEISARLTPLAVRGPGATAVCRRGKWYFCALERSTDPEDDQESVLRPTVSMPEPVGRLIPSVPCPRCAGINNWPCYVCKGTGKELDGVALTITDLAGHTKHVNVGLMPVLAEPEKDPAERPTASGIVPSANEIRLDRYYSVGAQANEFGIPPHFLRDHRHGKPLARELIDGTVESQSRDNDELVSRFLRKAARGRTGGRLLVLARPEPKPPIEDLVRAVLGLGLTLAVTARSAPSERQPPAPEVLAWRIDVLTTMDYRQPRSARGSRHPSLASAANDLATRFDEIVHSAMAVGKLEPLPVPQQAAQVRLDLGAIELVVASLAEIFPAGDLSVYIGPDSFAGVLGEPYGRVATGGLITDVLSALVAPELAVPTREHLRAVLTLMLDRDSIEETLQLNNVDTWTLEQRWHFGLAFGALAKCLFRERFGMTPDQADLEEYANETYLKVLSMPTQDDQPPPPPAAFAQMLASMADPTQTAWHRLLLEDQVSIVSEILGNLLTDRLNSGPEPTGLIDQAVEEGILMARAVTESGSKTHE